MSEQSPVRGFATAAANIEAPNRREAQVVGNVSYLNSAPFFRGLSLGERCAMVACTPRELGERAAAGQVDAGLLALADFIRLEERFERVGPFGIAVRGRVGSVLLFSRKPIRQLDRAPIAVTNESSTSVVLLRLLLEQRYHLRPEAYVRGQRDDAEALLLIGDEALRYRRTNTQYPFEIDLAFEWWLWQHLPCVFAVWAVRKDASAKEKKSLEASLSRALGINQRQLEVIAQDAAAAMALPAEELQGYLAKFIYRLSRDEEAGIAKFRELVHAHHLL